MARSKGGEVNLAELDVWLAIRKHGPITASGVHKAMGRTCQVALTHGHVAALVEAKAIEVVGHEPTRGLPARVYRATKRPRLHKGAKRREERARPERWAEVERVEAAPISRRLGTVAGPSGRRLATRDEEWADG